MNMTREELIAEQAEIRDRIRKADFINPADMRRLAEIKSLLLTDVQRADLTIQPTPPKRPQRVTSFTPDRR